MQVNSLSRNSQNFTGALNNKFLLKGLEKVSEHGMSVGAGTSLIMSLGVRPLAIQATPDVEKENKQYAIANSVGSGIIKFGMVEALALPTENAVKKIDKRPYKYLQNSSEDFIKSRGYKLGTQIMKLGTGLVTAIPKSMLTIALIPVIMDKIFNIKAGSPQKAAETLPPTNKNLSFKGKPGESIAKGIGKILDTKSIQKFLRKHETQDKDIAKHLSAGTDLLLTTSFAWQTNQSDKIKENRKKALIYNNVIATAITLAGGYGVDSLVKKKSSTFIEHFKKVNQGDPKLHKYIEGINIVRPALIFAAIYYGILPIFSTYMAEKIDKFITSASQSSNSNKED